MKEGNMRSRILDWQLRIAEEGVKKFEKHEHKGDWRLRKDKTLPYLMSGLIIEVGELQKALSREGSLDLILEECGDIFNYLVIIADSAEQEKKKKKKE